MRGAQLAAGGEVRGAGDDRGRCVETGVQRGRSGPVPQDRKLRRDRREEIKRPRDPWTEEEDRPDVEDRRHRHRAPARERHGERLGGEEKPEPRDDRPHVPSRLLQILAAEDREEERKRRQE